MTDKQIIINDVDVSGCDFLNKTRHCKAHISIMGTDTNKCKCFPSCYYKQLKRKQQKNEELKKTLAEIKELANPYKMTIKKICGNCKKYDDCHACCYKDINCYKYTSSETNACEEFVYLDEFVPNLLANNVLQKISECGVDLE